MNIKKASVATLLLLVVATGITYALKTTTIHVPTTWIINENVNVAVYINGTLWGNGTTLDWGLVSPASTITLDLTVINLGTLSCNVTVVSTMPLGYSLEWSSSGTVMPKGGTLSGDLTFTLPIDAVDGTADFYIIAEEVTP